MSGMPWWLQAYIVVAAFAFGYMLAIPPLSGKKGKPVADFVVSLALGVLWPITLIAIGGAMAVEVAEDSKRRR